MLQIYDETLPRILNSFEGIFHSLKLGGIIFCSARNSLDKLIVAVVQLNDFIRKKQSGVRPKTPFAHYNFSLFQGPRVLTGNFPPIINKTGDFL